MKSFLLLLVTVLVSRIGCLSLDEIHSSSKPFKSDSDINEDKTLRSAIVTIRRRRQEYPFAQTHQSSNLALQKKRSYESLVPFNSEPDQQLVDDFLGYNQIDSQYLDENLGNDLLSAELALKLSQLIDTDKGESDVGHRIYNRINRKRKRSTPSKQNSYWRQRKSIKGDKNELKNAKNLSKYKNKSYKTLSKRKSSRRVLNDHFNIEESHPNVVNKKRDTNVIKSGNNPLKPKVRANKKFENKIQPKVVKKTIRKRTAETSMNTGLNLETNDSKMSTKNTDKSVVNELYDILSDDNKNGIKNGKELYNKNLNKTQREVFISKEDNNQKKDKPEIIKRKNKRSDPNIDSLIQDLSENNDNSDKISEDIIVYPNVDPQEIADNSDNSSPNQMPNTNEDLNEWLKREFYENMAKTLATMRKKRSQDLLNDDNDNDDINPIEDSETTGDNIIAIEGTDFLSNDELKTGKSDDSDDDYVIATLDEENANDGNDNNDNNEEEDTNEFVDQSNWSEFLDKNRAAIKKKRSISSHFGNLYNNLETNEIDSRRFSRVNDNLESIEDTLLNEAFDYIRETAAKGSEAEANSDKIANRLDAAYDIEDVRTALEDLKQTFDKINNENNKEVEVQPKYEIDLTSPIYETTDQIDVHKKDSSIDNSLSESDSNCLALDMLSSSDCSSVSDLLPIEGLRYPFTESCNWHQICYTCGEIYGLMSSDCDAGFLEASRLSCAGSPSCEAFARLVLAPLRQSRVFYKSSVPQLCYQFQCIRDFLFDTKTTKH